MDRLLIKNCRLFDSKEKTHTSVLIEDGKTAAIGGRVGRNCDNILDADGLVLAPGFIDVHIQGAGGADVLDSTPEALATISKTCARFGVTSFLATTVYRAGGDNTHMETAVRCVGQDLGGANLLGIHLEGPFISPQKKGMIQPNCVCQPSQKIMDEIMHLTAGKLAMMTIAPELPDNTSIIRRLVDDGVVASFGHSAATYEQTIAGFDAGISHVTHLYNAMNSIYHRSPGPLVAIFENEHVTVQLISDGVHIHPAVVKMTFDLVGPKRTVVITDGMPAMGLPDGKYVYNSVEYEAKDGAARYKDGTLIGTALGLSELLRRFTSFTNCGNVTAIKTVTENSAKVLQIQGRKGSIAVGKDADLVLLNGEFSVHATIVGGKVVYRRPVRRV